jgi:hypothetical protein
LGRDCAPAGLPHCQTAIAATWLPHGLVARGFGIVVDADVAAGAGGPASAPPE